MDLRSEIDQSAAEIDALRASDDEGSELGGLVDVLYGEDELGAVVRAHILVESALNKLVEQLTPKPQHLTKRRREFWRSIDLGLLLGMPEDLAAPLHELAKIRNGFAHDPNAKLADSQVDAFTATLSQRLLDNLEDSFQKVAIAHPGFQEAGHFKKIDVRHRFALTAIEVWHALKIAKLEAILAEKGRALEALKAKKYDLLEKRAKTGPHS